MDRRDFLQQGVIGGTALVGGVRPLLREVEAQAPGKASQSAPQAPPPFELEEATVAQLQESMRSGRLTARAIAEQYLVRIDAVDRQGPTLRSVIETNPDALSIANQLDAERKSKGARGPLHGIPVLIKDNIDTADRMHTTAGSLALVDSTPPRDAFIAQRLREAGAVILGKANLSEWANFRSTRSTSGWSGRGGQTRNPYALDRNPCGSSSGSGAAISANLAALAIGTETDGSITCPASGNGLVGIKPTVGLVSRAGIIPISHTQDTAGPMCRTVADAAALLGAIAGADPRDPATASSRGRETDYTRALDANGLRGARIGVVRKFFGFSDPVDALMRDALDVLRRSGATLVDPAEIKTAGKFDNAELEVLLYEFKADLNAYLAERRAPAGERTLAELIAFNEKHREQEMPYFGQEIFVRAQAKGPLTDKKYRDALHKARRLSRAEGIDATMAKHRLDALVAPTGAPAWPIDLVNGDHVVGGGVTQPPSVAGYPHITVPAGFVFGLPVGLSFFGRAYSEPALIKFAYAFEQATKHRSPPSLAPTVTFK